MASYKWFFLTSRFIENYCYFSGDYDLFDRIRGQDIRLLKTLRVKYICDLMVEKKKVKFGMRLAWLCYDLERNTIKPVYNSPRPVSNGHWTTSGKLCYNCLGQPHCYLFKAFVRKLISWGWEENSLFCSLVQSKRNKIYTVKLHNYANSYKCNRTCYYIILYWT